MGRTGRSVAVVVACGLATALFSAAPRPASAGELKATLVKSIDLARLNPSSSDPAGIVYLPNGRLLIADCNIDEVSSFHGVNLWQLSASGSLLATGTTTRYSHEPTGLSYDERTSTLYVSDDDKMLVFSMRAGTDGKLGTSDDTTSSFSTTALGVGDPEDLTYDPDDGDLFIVDGEGKEVFRVSPGSQGTFDGGAGQVTHFDVARYGAGDPEGIVYDKGRKTLFVMDYRSEEIYEVDTSGRLVTTIDVSATRGKQVGGITIGPASSGRGMSFWIVDRGVNNAVGNVGSPNDGKLYEMSVDLPLGQATGGGPAVQPQDPGGSAGPGQSSGGTAPSGGSGGSSPGGSGGVPAPAAAGYRLAASDGAVFAYGNASFKGSAAGLTLARPIVASAATPSGSGYWLVASDGGVFAFGDAVFRGSTGGLRLARPIVGMAPSPSGNGYWLVASDGGIFAFGDAAFSGSTGNLKLAKPIVGMASTPTGKGYWLVASDGGIFAFGDAAFLGSTGSMRLAKPIVGMAPTASGRGYWLVASDGGIFSFGDAVFRGSTGALRLARPIVGMAPTPAGNGYWLVASDGGVFSFGDARFLGSAAALGRSIVGLLAR